MIDFTKFWIEGILAQKYARFLEEKGADLDENGKIEGNEIFEDGNQNGTLGDKEDYKLYLKKNRTVLASQIPFFKWSEKLSIDNRIHQLLYLESSILPENLIESAYVFLGELLNEIREQPLSNGPEEKLQNVYLTLWRKLGIQFTGQREDYSLSGNISRRELDCDTSSFCLLAVGDEMQWPLHLVVVPEHSFVRWRDGKKSFNIDFGAFGFIRSDDYYHSWGGIDETSIQMGAYLSDLTVGELEGEYLNLVASVLSKNGQNEKALSFFDRAVELCPKSIGVRINRSHALFKLKRLEEALEAADKAVRWNPDNPKIHFLRALALYEIGQKEETLQAIDRLMELDPKKAIAHTMRADILIKLGRKEEALKEFTNAVQLEPQSAEIHNNLGSLLCEMGRLEEGLQAFIVAAELNPAEVTFHSNRVSVLLDLSRKKEALEALDKMIALSPNNQLAHADRALILYHLKEYQKAIEAGDMAKKLGFYPVDFSLMLWSAELVLDFRIHPPEF